MATAENTSVKVYKGVPLMKDGTEVLYLSQSAAETALAGFIYKTYTKYYYARENRGSIQLEETIDNLEGANYLSYVNASHGTKIYFAFIDSLQYINDEVTQINFSIDPFPTYLNEVSELPYVHVVRNTERVPQNYNYAPDYLPKTTNLRYVNIGAQTFNCNIAVCYFVCPQTIGQPLQDLNGNDTGIQISYLTPTAVNNILTNNGSIIGAYMIPDVMYSNTAYPISRNLGNIVCDPFPAAFMGDILNGRWGKIRTGVYNKIRLQTPQGSKNYNIDDFTMPLSGTITFGMVGIMAPSPSVFVYPKMYKNTGDNLAEGIFVSLPAIPITTNAVYTQKEAFNDFVGALGMIGGGAVGGFLQGGLPMAITGAAVGFFTSAGSVAKNIINTQLETPAIVSNGAPVVSDTGKLLIGIETVAPDVSDVQSILNYFDYYGYNVDREQTYVNDDDGAYLQTGSEFLIGSEADNILNARLMAGVKIRKSFT